MCEAIKDFISYVEIILKMSLSIASISVIIWGGRKLPELLKSYNEKYLQAAFGYYINLQTYCMTLKEHLAILGNPDRSNYFNTDGDRLTDVTDDHCKTIRDFTQKFLAFFSSEKGQVPPNEDGFIDWMEKSKDLRERLCKCMSIGEVEPMGRDEFFKKIDEDLEYFLKIIPDIQNEIMNKFPRNS